MRKAQAAVSRGPQPRIALVCPERVAAGGDELEDAVEVGALEAGVGSGGDDFAVERVGHEWPRAGRAPHVLGEHIERALAVLHGVVVAGFGGVDRRPAFQHLEAVGGHQQRLRGLVEAVVGAADALDQPARALGRADVDDEVDVAPVDAEVERGGAHHGLERAGGHGGLDLAASRGVERAVVQRDGQAVVVDAPQLLEHQLGLAAGVDEHEAEPVRLDGGVDLGDGVAGGVAGPGQRQLGVEDAHVGPRAAFGDDEVGEADGAVAGLRLEVSAQLARPCDRRRQADAGMAGGDGSEPGKVERQQVAALGGGERMQLIEDDGGQPGKQLRRVGVGEQQGHLLGRCEQHVGRAHALARLARGRGIAGARLDADGKAHLLDRSEQVAVHVGGERLERGDVERVDAALPLRGHEPRQRDQARQEACERLARTGWRDQQGRAALRRLVEQGQLVRTRLPAAPVEPGPKFGGQRGHRVGPAHGGHLVGPTQGSRRLGSGAHALRVTGGLLRTRALC